MHRIEQHPILPIPASAKVPFTWNGRALEALAGETLSSALFAAGVGPGILACVMLIIPALLLSLYYNLGAAQSREPKPKLWQSFKEAFWALMAPVLILGGLRTGWFTPTEAAVMAVFYGLLVGGCIYRTLTLRDIFQLLVYDHFLNQLRRGGEE